MLDAALIPPAALCQRLRQLRPRDIPEALEHLKLLLGRLEKQYHRESLLSSDPLEFVHRFIDPHDQEAVALLAALLAYGNVRQIRGSVQKALDRMGSVASSPSSFVRSLADDAGVSKARSAFRGYAHRFNVGDDLVLLFWLLGRSWGEHGSLGAHFMRGMETGAPDIGEALDALIFCWRDWLKRMRRMRVPQSFHYLLTAPQDGSCCKRWCMFLRWMGRRDALDPGLWAVGGPFQQDFPGQKALSASQLVLPLDTHTGRISQYLGLTSRKTLNWKAAREITSQLKRINAEDPTRFDFALSRVGILEGSRELKGARGRRL